MINKNDLLEIIGLRPGITLKDVLTTCSFEFYHGMTKKDRQNIKNLLKELTAENKIEYIKILSITSSQIIFYPANSDLKVKRSKRQ